MGSTGESDRKRRHFSSIASPTAATVAKKNPFSHASDDKKHNITVLQFQNKKLVQKLEAQKVEYTELENKLSQKKEKQKPYGSTLNAVSNSWETLVSDVERCSNCIKESYDDQDNKYASISVDLGSSSPEEAFVSRLMETGATESSCTGSCQEMMEEDRETTSEKITNIIQNISGAISGFLHLNNRLHSAVLKGISEDSVCRKQLSSELHAEVKKLRLSFSDLHLKHRLVASQLQNHRDNNAKDKAELSRLKGESEVAVTELKDCRLQMAILKAERDSTQGTFFPVLSMGNKHVAGEKVREKQKDLEDMHSAVKELLDQSSSRLQELNSHHEQRIKTLQQLSNLQRPLKNVKCLSSSQPYLLVMEQLDKAKSELFCCQALFEKLQVEKNNLVWTEKELNMKNDLVDVLRRYSAVADSKVTDLKSDIQKQIDDKKLIETKLEEASKEPGRKGIIVDFKALLSSFPEEMDSMQCQLSNYKEEASDIHSLQADEQSLASVLDRKIKETENLLARSSNQAAEIQKLKSVVDDLKKSEQELKLFLDMYKRESTDSRDFLEAKDLEYRSWAKVQSLKSSLDEKTLELRVKTANEAEAISQQQLAAAEAEIADLRQGLDASRRGLSKLSQTLKAKSDENEAYLSEIETIGQAYGDMQTQNQHLLQQVTERDDYNVKLILEGTRARQQQDFLIFNNHRMGREIKQANISLDFYGVKAVRIEDQLKVCLEQSHKLAAAKFQNSVALDTSQKKLTDVRRSSDQARELLEDTQLKVDKSLSTLLERQIEIEKERFKKRRIEEEIEVARRKILSLRREIEGSSIVQKLHQELQKYREIVKCSICCDTPKQVVITRCYHLFCNTCVQKLIGSRQRKCPACSASFGPNDVKPVYI